MNKNPGTAHDGSVNVDVTRQDVEDIVDALERAAADLRYSADFKGNFEPEDIPRVEAKIARWESLIVSFANPLPHPADNL